MDYRTAFDLTGSVAVVTGGSRGIGFESAVALGSCGAKVVLVRLVARGRADQRGDGRRQGGARSAVPQPHAVRTRRSARDPGDGVRRAQPRLRLLQRSLHARHLRQHEDGRRNRVYRQRPPVQPPLSADVWPLPGRANRLHAGLGLGEGAGREPGRGGARAFFHAAAAGCELRGAERLVARPMRRLRQGA